jgi:hypothetical protein
MITTDALTIRAAPPLHLARAVLMFYNSGCWTNADRAEWLRLTGDTEATTRSLCNLARRVIDQATTQDQPQTLTGRQ